MSASLEDIVSLAKRRGFVYPGSEIYGGLAGVYDYGPLGVRLKRNIQNAWLKFFVDGWDDMYQIDAAILMNKKVWEASGHASGFNDPLVECSNCHSRLRADHIEGDKCPVCGKEGTLSEPRQFNMMLKTFLGPLEDENGLTYLPPETAQSIFVNFKNVVDSFYPDMPFGMAQIGKAFRNEISPREFLFRVRELELMEVEYFVHPDKWEESFEKWRKDVHIFFKKVGLPEDMVHELEVPEEDRAHYSKRTIDFEFDFPFGRRELLGLAYRGDYDLKRHQEASGRSMEYRPKDGGETFIPHVIEPSVGVGRLFLAILSAAYTEDEVEGEKRIYLKLPSHLAPVKVAVSPLLKNKPELVEKAKEVYKMLQKEVGNVMWDDNGNIGKRYRRQDEIGTPYCVTIDFQTLEDDTVTVRNRDTTAQERIKITALSSNL
ncbi:MAG: glycyl tRNA synthetase [Candidatus Saccharibacteria bacterium]|nr:glycyl tRNA synthetase [Candidatus Saccharibacteria bacterium]